MSDLDERTKFLICRLFIGGLEALTGSERQTAIRVRDLMQKEVDRESRQAKAKAKAGGPAVRRRKVDQMVLLARIVAEITDTEKVSRETIYRVMRDPEIRKFFLLVPPTQANLEDQLQTRFPGFGFTVVDNHAMESPEQVRRDVAARAGDRLHEHLIQLLQARGEAGLGIGSGKTSWYVAQRVGKLLRGYESPGGMRQHLLRIHALSSGFDPLQPKFSSSSAFTHFHGNASLKVEFVGLFTSPMVQWDQFEQYKALPGVKESFDRRDKIDLVCSSLASRDAKFGLLNRYVVDEDNQTLMDHDWIGDFQFLPFSRREPINAKTRFRAITLLTLEEIRDQIANHKEKISVLVCGPGKVNAILPLVTSPELKMCDEIAIDRQSGQALYDMDLIRLALTDSAEPLTEKKLLCEINSLYELDWKPSYLQARLKDSLDFYWIKDRTRWRLKD